MQTRLAFAKVRVRHDAERQTARGELLHRAARMTDQGRVVTGV